MADMTPEEAGRSLTNLRSYINAKEAVIKQLTAENQRLQLAEKTNDETISQLTARITELEGIVEGQADPNSIGSPAWLAMRMEERALKAEAQLAWTVDASKEPPAAAERGET